MKPDVNPAPHESAQLSLARGLHFDVSEKRYHADQVCDSPTLSCSIAKTLIDQSPLHAFHQHPRLGTPVPKETTPEMEFGQAAHALCLGKGATVAVCEADDWRTKDAKQFRSDARTAGQIPILAHKLAKAEAQRDALKNQLADHKLLAPFMQASPEVCMIYDDGPVRCRALLDKVLIDEERHRATIFDLKVTDSANPRGLGRLVWNMHYDLQERSYTSGLGLVRPDLAGRIDFIFLFIEDAFPFCLTPYQLSGEQEMLGTSKWVRAWTMWSACMKESRWPAYTNNEIVRGEAPKFALDSEMGAKPIMP